MLDWLLTHVFPWTVWFNIEQLIVEVFFAGWHQIQSFTQPYITRIWKTDTRILCIRNSLSLSSFLPPFCVCVCVLLTFAIVKNSCHLVLVQLFAAKESPLIFVVFWGRKSDLFSELVKACDVAVVRQWVVLCISALQQILLCELYTCCIFR